MIKSLVTYAARRPLIVAEDAEIVGIEVYLASEVDARVVDLEAEIERLNAEVLRLNMQESAHVGRR